MDTGITIMEVMVTSRLMEVMVMVINKPMEDMVTNLPTDTDTKVMEVTAKNNRTVDMDNNNLMVNKTVTTTNLTEHSSDSNFISVIT